MAIKFTCNVCNQMLSVADEHQGKKVRCPKCQTALAVPSAAGAPAAPMPPMPPMPVGREHVQGGPPPPPPEALPLRPRREDDYERRRDYDDRGYERAGYERTGYERGGYERGGYQDGYAPPSYADERAGLQSAALGMSFHAWRHYMFMTMILLSSVMTLISFFMLMTRGPGFGRAEEEMMIVLSIGLAILGIIVALLYFIFAFIGYGFCTRMPARSGAGPLNMTAMILEISVLVIILIIVLLAIIAASGPFRRSNDLGAIAGILAILGGILFIAAEVLFLVFVNRAAHYMGDSRLAGRAIGVMIGWLVTLFGGLLVVILVGVIVSSSPGMRGEGGAIFIMAMVTGWQVAVGIMYGLIGGVCSALRRRIMSEGMR
jgi:hypothetical protein